VQRAIHIFPKFSNIELINEMRQKYDPLAHLVPPHITLVFPFESEIAYEALAAHAWTCLSKKKPFHIMLRGVSGADEEYLFLNVKVGNDEIIALHDELYTGVLKDYLNRRLIFTPHLTVGRTKDKRSFLSALNETYDWNEVFETTVNEVMIERIGENQKSTILLRVPLLG
jgi:2'-5' RNA ligase